MTVDRDILDVSELTVNRSIFEHKSLATNTIVNFNVLARCYNEVNAIVLD